MCNKTSYADHAWHGPVEIVENVQVAENTYRLRVECPEIACRVTPGQFLMLRLVGGSDPLLGRPLALYDVIRDDSGSPKFVDVVYLAVGKMTKLLASVLAGSKMEMWGPLGNGFAPCDVDHLIMTAGGIGQTPFLTLGKESLGLERYGDPLRDVKKAKKATLLYGARNASFFAGVEDFRKAGIDVQLATDDGSLGRKGLVTELIEPAVKSLPGSVKIVSCGPEPMLKAVGEVAARLNVPCQVSLETPMACGIGICFSCVAKVRDESGNWDYRRTCVEGPVFDADRIEF